jgi:hypothetical protein
MAELQRYYRFTSKSRLEKAVFTLLGLFEGLAIDGVIVRGETKYFQEWLSEQQEYAHQHPFDEIMPVIQEGLKLGKIPEQERDDITWLCQKFRPESSYFDHVTIDLQRLHAIVAGIAADGLITTDELLGLSDWLSDHEHLRRCWPYDEIDSLITSVLADHQIDPREQALLLHFFSEFAELKPSGLHPEVEHPTLQGLCSVSPLIRFDQSVFCFTGQASLDRDELEIAVVDRGGTVSRTVSRHTHYLVIGAEGNPCWAYACYGRKVEQAVKLRQQGYPLVLVHETDFLDALND